MFAVAAGNDNRDACNYSPAGAPNAVTVGSSTRMDTRSSFSNWGTCVDMFAPGSDITAAWIGSDTEIKTISGTSMASPHTCGVLALLAAEGDYTPLELKAKLLSLTTPDKLMNVGKGSPNKLLFSNPPTKSSTLLDSLRFQ
jgi:subtilisin family serine protease